MIVSDTKIDRYYFNDSVGKFFKAEDDRDLAEAMLGLYRDKAQRDRFAANALQFVQEYSWDKKKQEYLDLVDSLVHGTEHGVGTRTAC